MVEVSSVARLPFDRDAAKPPVSIRIKTMTFSNERIYNKERPTIHTGRRNRPFIRLIIAFLKWTIKKPPSMYCFIVSAKTIKTESPDAMQRTILAGKLCA